MRFFWNWRSSLHNFWEYSERGLREFLERLPEMPSRFKNDDLEISRSFWHLRIDNFVIQNISLRYFPIIVWCKSFFSFLFVGSFIASGFTVVPQSRLWRMLCRRCNCCNALQRTATNCNALHRTASHCNALQRTATQCNALQRTATHCNALQRTATHCDALQRVVEHCNTHTRANYGECRADWCDRLAVCDEHVSLQHTATHCNTLQHTATHCNTLQRTARKRTLPNVLHSATHCNTCNALQRTAMHCSTLQHTHTS